MKILVTGAKGFVGKNLIHELKNRGYDEIYQYDIDSRPSELNDMTKDCDFVFHLAGVNRPKEEKEFKTGNVDLTDNLIKNLIKNNNKSPIMLSSSSQANLNNAYGISKKEGEDLLFKYGKEYNVKVNVYRFTNLFGKWSRPNYNSVIATFSHNIANNMDIKVNDPNVEIEFIYIDDVVNELINNLINKENKIGQFCVVDKSYKISIGELANIFYTFKNEQNDLLIPNINDEFVKKLYSTYLSYKNEQELNYPLHMNVDNRGSFTEFIKILGFGQVSINVSKPGIVKGNHWHHTKVEKFLVVSGIAKISLKNLNNNKIVEYVVSEDKLEVINIPPGYVHNLINLSDKNLITIIWANELFDENNPDTFYNHDLMG